MRSILRAIAWVVIVGVLLGGLVLADRLGQRPHEEPAPYVGSDSALMGVELKRASQDMIHLASAPAEKRHARRVVRASCQVQLDSNRQMLVKSFVSGMIADRLCEQGQPVKTGQPLFVMRSNDLALAKGAYLSAKAQLDLAKLVLDRDEVLIKDKIVSQTQYDTDRAAWLTARSAYVNSREQLLIDGLGEDDIVESRLRQPVDVGHGGRDEPDRRRSSSSSRTPTRAATSFPSGTDLCQVADLDAGVGQSATRTRRTSHSSTPARSRASSSSRIPGKIWEGPIETISEIVNQATRTVDVRVVCSNKPPADGTSTTPPRFPLKPGLFGTMDVDCEAYPDSWVWIPQSALLPYFYEKGEKGIFVAKDSDHFVERRVRVTSQEGTTVAVEGDLAPGERVVTEGNVFLTRHEEH